MYETSERGNGDVPLRKSQKKQSFFFGSGRVILGHGDLPPFLVLG